MNLDVAMSVLLIFSAAFYVLLGLRLWLVGLAFWLVGHLLAVWAAKRDAQIAEVARRHLRYPSWFGV